MLIASSIEGISVNYQCRNLRYTMGLFRPKCPDEYTDKCYRCKYCRADMSASDATRLLNSYRSHRYDKTLDTENQKMV